MKKYFIFLLTFLLSPSILAQSYQMGCLSDPKKYATVPLSAPLTSRSFLDLPSIVSLKKYAPIPQHQGEQGSCVGWATSYAARSILENIATGQTDSHKNTQTAFSPSYIYNQVKLTESCYVGSYIEDALQTLLEQGTLPLTRFPYKDDRCFDKPSRDQKSQASEHRIATYERIFDENNDVLHNINAIKKSLSQQKPVIIGFKCYESFRKTKNVWSGRQDNEKGLHAITIVGYDNDKYGGAFELMNSWGTEWGKNGFAWVRYEVLIHHLVGAFEVSNQKLPKPNEVQTLKAELQLIAESEDNMRVVLTEKAYSDIDIVEAESSTYNMLQAYSSGTKFRISISSQQASYMYVLGFGTKSKKVMQLYPFKNYSPHFPDGFSEVSIPDENHFMRLDDKVGKDYLCLLYSTEPLEINDIITKLQAVNGSLLKRIQKVLKEKILKSDDIEFERNRMAFTAKATTKTIVPIVVEFEHVE